MPSSVDRRAPGGGRGLPRACWVGLTLAALLAGGCGRKGGSLAPASVHGRVVDLEGRPLPGSRLELPSTPAGGVPAALVTAGADGRFAMQKVKPGPYRLVASHEAFADAEVAIDVGPGEDLAVVVRLDRSIGLQGRVEDRSGRPVPTALVLAWPIDGERAAARETTTDEQGRFRLSGPARGSYTVLVEGPGFGAIHLGRVEIPGRPVVVRLDEDGRVVSGIVERGGAAAVGARVVLGGPGLRAPRTTVAAAGGAFSFGGLGPGSYTVRATHAGLASPPSATMVGAERDGVRGIRLLLAPGGTISGRVVDEAGKAVVAAAVDVQAVPADDCPEVGRTDVVGYFQLGPVAPGRYSVAARLPGYVLRAPVTVMVGVTEVVANLRLERGAGLRGQVLDGAGRPLGGAVVSVTAASMEPSAAGLPVLPGRLPLAAEAAQLPASVLPAGGRTRAATTDPEGRFALADVAPGPVRVQVTHAEHLPTTLARLVLDAGQDKPLPTVRLNPGNAVMGRVLQTDGTPLPGARVTARRSRGSGTDELTVTNGTDPEGRFAFRLPPGRYTLQALAEGRVSESATTKDVQDGQAVDPIEFRLRTGNVVVQGLVKDARGRALAGATVTARHQTGDVELARVVTGLSGRFRLTGLPDQGVSLLVRHAQWPATTVPARSGGDMLVQLQTPGAIEGEVRERGNGRFVTGATVQAIGADGQAAGTVRMLGAGFQIGGLRPGPWTLRVGAPGYGVAERPIDVPPAPSAREPSVRDVIVELEKAPTAAQ